MKTKNLYVLVTGGTSGIGKCIAEGFAKAGYNVLASGIGDIPKSDKNIEYFSLNILDQVSIKRKFNSDS